MAFKSYMIAVYTMKFEHIQNKSRMKVNFLPSMCTVFLISKLAQLTSKMSFLLSALKIQRGR